MKDTIIQRDICSLYQLTEDAVSRYKRTKPDKFEAMKAATFAVQNKISKSKILKLVQQSKNLEDKAILLKAEAAHIEAICEHFKITEDDLKNL